MNNRLLKSRLLLIFFLLTGMLSGCGFQLNPSSLNTDVVTLRFTHTPISFDDISYDAHLKKVIVPAGQSGSLVLIDPATKGIQEITGFGKPDPSTGTVIGTTSAVAAKGMIFALDKDWPRINIIDPGAGKITGTTPVQGPPDYIRFVAATNELWVTERILEQIEVFAVSPDQPVTVTKSGVISVPNGPEALLIDQVNGLAYTNQPKISQTAVIQVNTHNIIYEWGNGCSKARGMTLDSDHGLLFVACGEGKLVMMDTNQNGLQITSQTYGGSLDFVTYNPRLQHIYLPSATSGILAVFAVVGTPVLTPTPGAVTPTADLLNSNIEDTGGATPVPGFKYSLVRLGTADTAVKARCVTTDDQDNIWVCDPLNGQLFMIHDTFPPGGS